MVGQNWLDRYIESLDENQKSVMTSVPCNTPFKFGDGKSFISKYKVKIPGQIGKNKVLIEANVVTCDIPLLLSKPSLKKVGAILNFDNDSMMISGQVIKLVVCKSGHYCIPICSKKRALMVPGVKVFLTVTQETLGGTDPKLMEKKALKLHRQFAHAPAYRIKSLLKSAGFTKKLFLDALDRVCESCEVCQRYKKPKPRPVVGLPRGTAFNDCVAIDLKTVNGQVTFLHMIDCATRYSVAKLVPNKRKETIIEAICTSWIAPFWPPKRLMSDNGGEFSNADMVELCERFDVELQHSAAESPFSNGLVERHHRVLAESMVKTKEESGCSWESALAWALSAKNSLQMNGGFSPFQLMMGRNPKIPNVIDSNPPALQPESGLCHQVEKHLKLHRSYT